MKLRALFSSRLSVSVLAGFAAIFCLGCEGKSRSGLPLARVPAAGAELKIDGVLSDGEWAESAFRFKDDADSGEVWMAWRPEGLAIAFSAKEGTPVYGGFPQGESLHRGDLFEVFVDPAGDHRQYYEIQVDPSGRVHLINHVLTAEPETLPSLRFSASFLKKDLWSYVLPEPEGMQLKSQLDAGGRWTVELFLPAAGFLARRLDGETVGPSSLRMNFCRVDTLAPGRQEVFTWAKVEPGCQHISPQAMGIVELVK